MFFFFYLGMYTICHSLSFLLEIIPFLVEIDIRSKGGEEEL